MEVLSGRGNGLSSGHSDLDWGAALSGSEISVSSWKKSWVEKCYPWNCAHQNLRPLHLCSPAGMVKHLGFQSFRSVIGGDLVR